ncbi:MAG: NADH-quinone oxidoreductase subunit B [Bacteroidetes bacterium]|nr:MAG: NADH-quinone oxidoreductase subunit B [Bacteroidota bacterium]
MYNDKNSKKIVETIQNWARSHSIWVLAYGTGCGAIEISPTMTSRYDAERLGFRGAATPRQADVMLITGYLTVKTVKRVVRVYEQMQSPKYVVGFGSCTINGGMYYDSYNTINLLDRYLPVDVYINGCMPRPEAVLAGLSKLQQIIREGNANGAEKYLENLAWYKENQRKIAPNWIAKAPDLNW